MCMTCVMRVAAMKATLSATCGGVGAAGRVEGEGGGGRCGQCGLASHAEVAMHACMGGYPATWRHSMADQ